MHPKPNILFVLTDDQRFDTIGALGNPEIRTPNMDRLVAMGTSFTQAHIPGGTCGAICCPSRAMLHTGRTLFHLDGVGERIPEEHVTLGEQFRNAGYQTFATGKWHNGRESFNRSFSDGEHIFFGGMADHWNVPSFHYDPEGAYGQTFPRCVDPFKSNEVHRIPGDHMSLGVHSSDLLADAAADWIGSREGDRPWMAYLSFLAPHDPRTMPPEYLCMYPPEEVELPPNFMAAHPYDTGALQIRDELLEAFPRTPGAIRKHIAEYRAMITHLDDCLGRVLDVLEKQGELENTVIVFTGDNGLAVGQHGLMGKQNHYEHSIRVPLIFSGPGIRQGEISEAPVYLLDIFPTLCEHLGLAVPASVEGCSFAPLLRGEEGQARERMFFAYENSLRSVKKGRYKFTLAAVDGQPLVTRMFDLQSDPWETKDLSCDPAFRELRAGLEQDLRQLASEWDDPQSTWGQTFWSRAGDSFETGSPA
ncbi:MAG: sulfatase-like hydrolase/transferase [Oceanipulchritudo sp.]